LGVKAGEGSHLPQVAVSSAATVVHHCSCINVAMGPRRVVRVLYRVVSLYVCVCVACAVANRILSVGDSGRASLLATFFDDPSKTFTRASTRGFVIHTGRRKGVRIRLPAVPL
jgi:hypothetical protein